ncbi:helix-turn-helix transcriptional regulator [Pseudoalteromonas maricaloris]|uniref:helix-turn-helix transcriptional regulator n=1 Tax=Pseudoalteromonas maricaloris TaxID=184924 RepID=UPI00068D6BDA|nr:AlpA family phage regulatory protein [Pseudoalteromonas flavipulchra]MBD0781915.1 AlpA family phage regulatory protein [Pseudoalteromonas flavipulchra]
MEVTELRKNIDDEPVQESERFIKLNDVLEMCCLCRAQLYKLMELGLFPPSHKMLSGRVVWLASDINIWRSMKAEAFKKKYAEKLRAAKEQAA